MRVDGLHVRVVLNSKAEPTLEVGVKAEGAWFFASAPSGTSTGKYEVKAWPEAPDVNIAVETARKRLEKNVFPRIEGRDLDPTDVDRILEEVDGTQDFSFLGGNAALALSVAAHKAYAWCQGIPLFEAFADLYGFKPNHVRPLENFVGGGAHGGNTDIQEFLVSTEAGDMEKSVLVLSWLYRETKSMLRERDPSFSGALTLESAFVTALPTDEILSILRTLSDFISDMGYGIELGVDVAAGEMWDGKAYVWRKEGKRRDPEEQMEYIERLTKDYGLSYVEDPFHEDAFEDFVELQRRVDATVTGDDLFATDARRLRRGIRGIIVKPNQRGTIGRTVETVKAARRLGMKIIVSHRSGETDDAFLAHLAVGVGADYAKFGAAGIRIVRLNELIRISEIL